jgi:hypothetical protein
MNRISFMATDRGDHVGKCKVFNRGVDDENEESPHARGMVFASQVVSNLPQDYPY